MQYSWKMVGILLACMSISGTNDMITLNSPRV